MGKWDVNIDDYERREGTGYDGDPPKPGVYEAKMVSYGRHENGKSDTSVVFVFEITEEPYAGWRGWIYCDLEGAEWRMQQIVDAAYGKNRNMDPEKSEAIVKAAKPVKVRVKKNTFEGEYRPKINVILPMAAAKKRASKGDDDDPWDDDEG